MTDKEILGEVYFKLNSWKDETRVASEGNGRRIIYDRVNSVTDFIEQEWQRQDEIDEQEQKDVYADSLDVSEIERHRGLVIGEDGTVNDLK